jgi:hypothetical protein
MRISEIWFLTCVLLLIVWTPIFTGDVRAQPVVSYPFLDQPSAGGQVWVNTGVGTVDGFFTSGSDYEELGTIPPGGIVGGNPPVPPEQVETNAEILSYVLHVGASLDVVQVRSYDLSLGADLGLVEQHLTSDDVTFEGPFGPMDLPGADATSGFDLQQLTLFAEATGPVFGARAGYQFDLGPALETGEVVILNDASNARQAESDDRENSDRQDAVVLGLSARHPFMGLRVFGGFDYFLLLENEGGFEIGGEPEERVYDQGNITSLRLGAGYRLLEALEVGLTGLLRFNSEGRVEGLDDFPPELGQQSEFESGYVFGLVPHVTYAPPGSPVQVSLRGAVQREYYDYGYSIVGESDIAPRLGVTLGVVYGF